MNRLKKSDLRNFLFWAVCRYFQRNSINSLLGKQRTPDLNSRINLINANAKCQEYAESIADSLIQLLKVFCIFSKMAVQLSSIVFGSCIQ